MKHLKNIILLLTIFLMLCSCNKEAVNEVTVNNFEERTLLGYIPDYTEVLDEYKYQDTMDSYELNNKGYELYENRMYYRAASLFQEAINRDNYHPFASYNLACMLALILENGGDIDIKKISNLIINELSQDPSIIEKVKIDPKLQYYRDSAVYKKDYRTFLETILNGQWYIYDGGLEFSIYNLDDYSVGWLTSSSGYDEETGDVWHEIYYDDGYEPDMWNIDDDYTFISADDPIDGYSFKRITFDYIDLEKNGEVKRLYRSTTLLHQAVHNNNLKQVKSLIERGVNLNSKIFYFSKITEKSEEETLRPDDFVFMNFITPLYIAIKNNNIEMMKYLLDKGATLNPSNDYNYSYNFVSKNIEEGNPDIIHPPFVAAIENDNVEIAEILLNEYNLDFNFNFESTSYLVKSVSLGSLNIIKFLAENGVDLNRKHWGNRSIYFFVDENDEVIDLLEGLGANK